MPQMAPISWLMLFMIFSISFVLFNVMNYFCFNNNKKQYALKNMENKFFSLNWKW